MPKTRPRLINAQAAEPCRDFLQVGGELGKADVEMLLAMIVDPTASALSDVSHTKQAGDAPSCADPRNTTPNTGMTMIITAVRPLRKRPELAVLTGLPLPGVLFEEAFSLVYILSRDPRCGAYDEPTYG